MEYGVPRNKLCLLYAIREALGDPTWMHPYLLMHMSPEHGTRIEFEDIGRIIGFVVWDSFRIMWTQGGNDEFFEAIILKTQKRYYVHRNSRTIFSYQTDAINNVQHTIALPFHVAACMTAYLQNVMIAIDPHGIYSMGRPMK